MKSLKHKLLPQLIIICSRYLLGGSLVFASLIKIKGRRFTTVSGENEPMGTVFHFFETMYQTGLYWQFIGMAQLLAGFLLLSQRWAKLGAVVTLPIMLNVFIITLSIPGFNYTPLVTGMMLFANVLLIAWHWNELRFLINLEPKMETVQRLEHSRIWEQTGLAIFLFTFMYRLFVDSYDPVLWFGVCGLICGVGFIIGLRNRKALRSEKVSEKVIY